MKNHSAAPAHKRIVILNGHPATQSLSGMIADRYEMSARQSGHHVERFDLAGMTFNSDFGQSSYRNAPKLEPDLERFWLALAQSDHFVVAHPLWWGGMPAKLKGLFDRVLLPGKAFAPKKGASLPDKLLKDKSARVFITSDTPSWYLRLFLGAGIVKQVKRQILGYVGFAPVHVTNLAVARNASQKQRDQWLDKVSVLAGKAR
ncbi:MAG: hypothetical protein CMH13_03555 [Martelella sp.]|uniref:NAD(P)H-dependent oxidoreductase n=1 Tax=unclassified Martelella TaxID=2629616 RepID=UPI000C696AAC|nr:NAD(P)H-dependent oxidoreductase [Martelella sp.]MAU19589.1 hypothetical protein [Martelella sp.]